jgi:hypothetical protein
MVAIPRAAYRLQLNSHFTFDDARAAGPCLAAFGIELSRARVPAGVFPRIIDGGEIAQSKDRDRPSLSVAAALGALPAGLLSFGSARVP